MPFSFDVANKVRVHSFGSVNNPLWAVTVSAPENITTKIAAANRFNDPPAEGHVFAGFTVTITLLEAETVPLRISNAAWSWDLVGSATKRLYGDRCGVVGDDAFDNYIELLVGGSHSGTACVELPVEDLNSGSTKVRMNTLGNNNVFFGG